MTTDPDIEGDVEGARPDGFPPGPETVVDLPENADYLLTELADLKRRRATLDAGIDGIEAAIKAMMGEAETAAVNGKDRVRYAWVTTRRLDQKALKKNHAEVYEQCVVTSTHRRFTLVGAE